MLTHAELDRFALMNARGETIESEVIGDMIAEIRRLRLGKALAEDMANSKTVTSGNQTIFNSPLGAGVMRVGSDFRGQFRRANPGERFYVGERCFVVVTNEDGSTRWTEEKGWD